MIRRVLILVILLILPSCIGSEITHTVDEDSIYYPCIIEYEINEGLVRHDFYGTVNSHWEIKTVRYHNLLLVYYNRYMVDYVIESEDDIIIKSFKINHYERLQSKPQQVKEALIRDYRR